MDARPTFPSLLTLLCCAPLLLAAKPSKHLKAKPKARADAQAAATPASAVGDEGLLDWSQVPFSDFSSHGVLLRQPAGLAAWRLRSSFAFGSQAAMPHPAKDLFDFKLLWKVEGEIAPRFAEAKADLKSFPRWAQESAGPSTGSGQDLRADVVTVFSGTDVVVAACSLTNVGSKPLRVRPILRLDRALAAGFKASLEASPRFPALWLGLDRGAMVGRPLQEWAGVWMGAQNWRIEADPAFVKGLGGQGEPLSLSRGASVRQEGALGASLTWTLPQLLAPKQTLRVPLMIVWGTDKNAVQTIGPKEWVSSAQPKGKAWKAAQERWAATRARLPQGIAPPWQPLAKRAALTLMLDAYGKRGGLNMDLFSADKGTRDAFYSVESSIAALGWAELDLERAEGALLELASFAAAAPAPVPPYTGEEKLEWEASGLPLHGWAAWELYHRDPDLARAGRFLSTLGPRLRNESAWWPAARDGDGNGLYAFSKDEEKPAIFLAALTPSPTPPSTGSGQAPVAGTTTAAPSLQTYSVALSSLVAWQMQAASALAGAAAQNQEADELLQRVDKTRNALRTQAWDPASGSYGPGGQAFWPFLLGLDADPGRAEQGARQLLAQLDQNPWAPWERYYQIRTLAALGYLKESRQFADQTLAYFEKYKDFCSICDLNGPKEGHLDGASAAVALALCLEREQQEIFLTDKLGPFEARWLQFHSLDSSFYMKRLRIPEKKAIYSKIKVETPTGSSILTEKIFTFVSDEAMAFQIQSEWPLDIARADKPTQLIFHASHKIELLVPAKTKYWVHILPH